MPASAAASATAATGIRDRTGEGSASRIATVRTAWTTCPAPRSHAHGPQSEADVVGIAPVAHAAVDVADDPARQREVEEERPVVGRDGGGQRERHAEPARDDRPPPCAADRGDDADGRAAASARASIARRPSANGPVPSRQTTTASHRAAAAARPGAPTSRGSPWQHQQVGMVDGDKRQAPPLWPGPDECARRCRPRRPARHPARRRRPATPRTTRPRDLPRPGRGTTGWDGRRPPPRPAGARPRRGRRRRGRAGGRSRSCGAGGRRTPPRRERRAAPRAPSGHGRRQTGSGGPGTRPRRRARPAGRARPRSAGRAAPRP